MLLVQVEKLSALLGVVGTEYTCETAGYFWLLHVLSRCGLGWAWLLSVAASGRLLSIG